MRVLGTIKFPIEPEDTEKGNVQGQGDYDATVFIDLAGD